MLKNFMKGSAKYAPWILISLISLICIIVFRRYLLLKDAFLFWDINDDAFVISYPRFTNIANNILKYGIPKWSFKVGMGQNMFPFLLDDPFNVFVFMAGPGKVASMFIYVEVLKMVLSGLVFFYYMRTLKLADYTCILGGLLFAFCSFIVVGGPFFLFSFQALNLAIYLLAFERLFTRKGLLLFPFAVFLTAISQPFNLYLYGVFIGAYACLRHVTSENNGSNTLLQLFGRMLGLAMTGILLSGPFFLANVDQILHSARGSGLTSYTSQLKATPMFSLADKKELGTAIMRLFSNDLLGSSDGFKGWFDYIEAPMFYCGLPCLLAVPQLFFFLRGRARTFYIVFMLLWLVPVFFPYFRYALWAFAGNYYRLFSFFISAIILYYAVLSIELILRKRSINVAALTTTLAIYVLLLCCPLFFNSGVVHNKVRIFVIAMLAIYAALLVLLAKTKNIASFKLLFLLTVFCELCYATRTTAKGRAHYTMAALHSKVPIPFHNFSYEDWSLDAVKYIQHQDQSFYRIDRSCDSSDILNASQIQGYNGTSCYCSFNQLSYIRYLLAMGVIDKHNEASSRWIQGTSNIPILEAENCVKYFLRHHNDQHPMAVIWDSLTTVGNVTIYKNNSLLPFGYTCDQYIKTTDFEQALPEQRQLITTTAFVIDDKDANRISTIKEYKAMKDPVSWKNNINALRTDTLTITRFNDNYLSGKIAMAQDKMLYLSIPYDEGWHLLVDGKPQKTFVINGGMTGALVTKGAHTITMSYGLRFGRVGMALLFAGIAIIILLQTYAKRKAKAITPVV